MKIEAAKCLKKGDTVLIKCHEYLDDCEKCQRIFLGEILYDEILLSNWCACAPMDGFVAEHVMGRETPRMTDSAIRVTCPS